MRTLHLVICATLIVGQTSATLAQVVPGPGYMVWQQGVNRGAKWQELGCLRDYESDEEKEEMIRRGECRNARPAAVDQPPREERGTSSTPPARSGATPSGPPAGSRQP